MRIHLNVPYRDKERAKSLGAVWDAKEKKWGVPQDRSIADFDEWLPHYQTLGFNVYSSLFWIAQGVQNCWKCKKETFVFSFLLPPNFLYFDFGEEWQPEEEKEWMWLPAEFSGFVFDITWIDEHALKEISRFSKNRYKVGYSKTADSKYYMNHCLECGAKQGDFFMYNEPNGTFNPFEHKNDLKLYRYTTPLYVDGWVNNPLCPPSPLI